LGVGYRSLGVCGKGASMSGLGSRRRAIWIHMHRWDPAPSLKRTSAQNALNQERSNEGNASKRKGGCHLQNCISPLVMCFYFHTNFGFTRYKIGKKGYTVCTERTAANRLLPRFQQHSVFATDESACFARETLLTGRESKLEEKARRARRGRSMLDGPLTASVGVAPCMLSAANRSSLAWPLWAW